MNYRHVVSSTRLLGMPLFKAVGQQQVEVIEATGPTVCKSLGQTPENPLMPTVISPDAQSDHSSLFSGAGHSPSFLGLLLTCTNFPVQSPPSLQRTCPLSPGR